MLPLASVAVTVLLGKALKSASDRLSGVVTAPLTIRYAGAGFVWAYPTELAQRPMTNIAIASHVLICESRLPRKMQLQMYTMTTGWRKQLLVGFKGPSIPAILLP